MKTNDIVNELIKKRAKENNLKSFFDKRLNQNTRQSVFRGESLTRILKLASLYDACIFSSHTSIDRKTNRRVL